MLHQLIHGLFFFTYLQVSKSYSTCHFSEIQWQRKMWMETQPEIFRHQRNRLPHCPVFLIGCDTSMRQGTYCCSLVAPAWLHSAQVTCFYVVWHDWTGCLRTRDILLNIRGEILSLQSAFVQNHSQTELFEEGFYLNLLLILVLTIINNNNNNIKIFLF